MNNELRRPYRNGEVISQEQFTHLVLSQETISALTLITMAYNLPIEDGNAMKIHRHLLSLAESRTAVTIGIDNTYGNRVEPKSDLPIFVAKLIGHKALLEKKERAYQELALHPQVKLKFNGAEHTTLFPFRNIDHRKLLLVSHSLEPDFAVIFGFNINYQLDSGVIDSGVFLQDQDALEWLKLQAETEHFTKPSRIRIGDFTFVTRELTKDGNELANNETREVINSAREDIIFCGQWLPDGETFNALCNAARRGVRVFVFSNLPPVTRQPAYALLRLKLAKDLARAAKQTGNIRFYIPSNPTTFFHVKALLTDVHNQKNSVALTGNDNMTNKLLQQWGLRDIMIRLDKPELVEDLYRYIEKNIFPNAIPFDFNELSLRQILISALRRQ